MWLFFFSSRRRHTRWTGDWSSDVCSSDLGRRCALFGLRQLGSLERGAVENVVLARLEAVEIEMMEHFAEYHGAGDDHRRPVGIECRDLPAFREWQRREALELRADAFARKAVALHQVGVVLGEPEVEGGDRGDGSGDADRGLWPHVSRDALCK